MCNPVGAYCEPGAGQPHLTTHVHSVDHNIMATICVYLVDIVTDKRRLSPVIYNARFPHQSKPETSDRRLK